MVGVSWFAVSMVLEWWRRTVYQYQFVSVRGSSELRMCKGSSDCANGAQIVLR